MRVCLALAVSATRFFAPSQPAADRRPASGLPRGAALVSAPAAAAPERGGFSARPAARAAAFSGDASRRAAGGAGSAAALLGCAAVAAVARGAWVRGSGPDRSALASFPLAGLQRPRRPAGRARPAVLQESRGYKVPTLLSEPAVAPIALTDAVVAASDTPPASWAGDVLVLPFWEAGKDEELVLDEQQAAVDEACAGALRDLIADREFRGKAGTSALVALPRGAAPARCVAVVGLGAADKFKAANAAKLGEALAAMATEQKSKTLGLVLPPLDWSEALLVAVLEAALLGLSPDKRYKSATDDDKPPPLARLEVLGGAAEEVAAAGTRARTLAAALLLTRGLVAAPPNLLTPSTMATTALQLAAEFPEVLSAKVLEREECAVLGMGAYLGVAQGSIEAPKFIHLTYSPPGGAATKKVALVGKGLTFDSGGYNIKAGAGSMIEKMKFDMGGAGAVLGAVRAVAELAPAGVEVHFIVAACENMVSEQAMRPGDILTASNGKTIEVLNTDAEGRLTLADALTYADRLGDLDVVVDIATLTGACIVALGPDYAAIYSDDDALLATVDDSARKTGELWWRMPLAPEYAEQIKSPIADLANLGGPKGGGSITAALFLKEFVKDRSPDAQWAHMDIAGPVWNDARGGATGFGVRTLVGIVESSAA